MQQNIDSDSETNVSHETAEQQTSDGDGANPPNAQSQEGSKHNSAASDELAAAPTDNADQAARGRESTAQDGNGSAVLSEHTDEDDPVTLLQKAQERISELENELLRSRADVENVKRRYERQISDAHKYAIERFSLEVLVLRDHMELGAQSLENIDKIEGDAGETIRKGFEMVLNSFPSLLKRFDICEIDCANKPFDPNLHEAVGQVESEGVAANHIVSVRQKGYTISDRLLRPALVVIAK